MENKVMTMKEAIERFVHDGDTLTAEGFTHLIPHAAGHEIIRQRKKDLILCRLTPDIIYDQLIAAGCAKKLVFSWVGNPGVGSLYGIRRAVEKGIPKKVEVDEYCHFGMVCRLVAGASNLPFMILKSYSGSDLPKWNNNIKKITCPYTGKEFYTVPALNPDIAIIHAQRADRNGNTQIWGILGVQKEACFASKRVIVSVEEIVDEDITCSDPNRTLIPGLIVDAVVEEPFGAHPSYVQGYYDRDNEFYIEWKKISQDEKKLQEYFEEWIYGVKNRDEYIKKLAGDKINSFGKTSFALLSNNYYSLC